MYLLDYKEGLPPAEVSLREIEKYWNSLLSALVSSRGIYPHPNSLSPLHQVIICKMTDIFLKVSKKSLYLKFRTSKFLYISIVQNKHIFGCSLNINKIQKKALVNYILPKQKVNIAIFYFLTDLSKIKAHENSFDKYSDSMFLVYSHKN